MLLDDNPWENGCFVTNFLACGFVILSCSAL